MTTWPVPVGHADGLTMSVGHAASWHEPGYPTFVADRRHAYATLEVVSAPGIDDLLLASGETGWERMRSVALAILSDAALAPGCDAFEVRYVVTPVEAGPNRVQLFVTAKAHGGDHLAAQSAVSAACERLPPGFRWTTPECVVPLGDRASVPDGQIVVELRRDEQVTFPQWDYIPADFYYTVEDDPGDGIGWPGFWRTLAAATRPVTVSLLFHQTELHWQERDTLGAVVTDLARLSQERTEYDFMNRPMVYPACANAKAALESWERRLQQLHRPLLARLAVRADVATAATVATSLATAIAGARGTTGTHPMLCEPPTSAADVRQADFGFDWLEILPWGGHGVWDDERAPMTLRRLPYLFGLNEAAGLLALPVPDDQGVAGMPRTRAVAGRREDVQDVVTDRSLGLELGRALDRGALGGHVVVPLTALTQHTLVVGASGWGKTTTVMSMLMQLWRDHHVPFAVVESVKAEYRSLAFAPAMDDLAVITLGNESVAPLRLNPLAPPEGVRCESHRSAVMAALKMALPLFPPLPHIIAKSLARAFDRAGWDDDTTIADGLRPPTLRDLLTCFRDTFAEIGYEGEAQNIGRAFETRLDGLLQGSLGKLLDTVTSSAIDDLLTRPVVFEMDEIHDADDRAVIAGFLLDRIRAAARGRRGQAGGLRHVTVIEEAHRLLSHADADSGDAESGDRARADAVKAFTQAIAELRSYGEGFVLSTQSPTQLAPAAIANTATRIVHRMESAKDRDAMLDDFGADQKTRDLSARLGTGEALARWPQRDEVELLKIVPDPSVDSGRVASDRDVADRMQQHRHEVAELLPYVQCTDTVCTTGCAGKVRRVGMSIGERTGATAARLWSDAAAREGVAVTIIRELLAPGAGHDLRQTYCAAVHLSVLDAAFRPRPGRDDRPALVDTVRAVTDESPREEPVTDGQAP